MADDARAIDLFIAASADYAERMAATLSLDRSRLGVVFPGLDPAPYRPADVTRRPAAVGFLSRLSAEEGFDRFVDAFLLLKRDPRFADARLAATGGPSADRHFLNRQLAKLRNAGALAGAEVSPSRFADDRFGFLSGLTLLSVPGGQSPEAFGYYALEAMAAGVPVVLPARGAFPEIAAAAGCGTLTADARPETLARAWTELLSDPGRLRREAERGRAAARARFSLEAAAAAFEAAAGGLTADPGDARPATSPAPP
jgi:glycosyltransferase involved in cell wall biosynthesis